MPTDKPANCTIAVSLYNAETTPQFSYYCSSSSSGWQVRGNGSIHPPACSRVIELRPIYPSGAYFTGFQLVSDKSNFKPKTEDPWWVEPELESCVLEPAPFPPSTDDISVLKLDFTAAPSSLLFYQVAINDHWDDPKIYDDGSE